MSVNAQLAQGTTLHISGSAATAEALTAITVGYPTILAITGHEGVANGDVVTLANFTGTDAALLNGKSFVVTHYATGTTNDTFTIDVNTVGKAITIGTATATPTAWIKLGEVKTIKPTSATAPDIDVTDLDSTAKEFLTGLMDNGDVSIDVNVLESDVGQAAFLAAFSGSTSKNYKITSPKGIVRTFTGSVKQFPTIPDTAVDGVLTGSVQVKISGSITVS